MNVGEGVKAERQTHDCEQGRKLFGKKGLGTGGRNFMTHTWGSGNK